MWKPLKMALNAGKIRNEIPKTLTSNTFNKYFTNIGTKLAEKFTNQGDFSKIEQVDSTFKPHDISVDTIENKLRKLDKHSKMDLLQFDCKLLQISSKYISCDIAHMFNLSISQAKLPND